MEPCLPVANALGGDPTAVVDAKHSEPPIVVPCQQTYHAECLRELFTSTLSSSPYHPPRCCGYFIPLSMLYTLYSDQPTPPPAAATSPTEKGAATEEISEKSASTGPKRNDALASSLAAFREVTENAVDCSKCKKWVLPQDIDEDKETAHCNPKFGGCGATTCVICNGPAHPPPSAPKGKAAKFASKPGCTKVNDDERGEVRFKRLVGREGWRQCGKCGWMLSRDTGCCEVICRCGHYETLAF